MAQSRNPTPEALRDAERSAQEARDAARAAAQAARAAAEAEQALARQRAEAGRRAVAAEQAADAAEAEAREAAAVRDAALVDLQRRAEAIAPLLPLMRRLSQYPSETLLAVPGDPETALRGALVLRSLTRHLSAEAAALRQAQAVAAEATRKAEAEAAQLAEARAERQAAAAAVEAALAQARTHRSALAEEEKAAAREAASAATRAGDLREMLERLERARARAEAEARARAEREREAAERAARLRAEREAEALAARQRATRDAAQREALAREQAAAAEREQERRQEASRSPAAPPPTASGGRAVPVAGRVTRDFGDSGAGGPARGLTYTAPAQARVVSPCGGSIAFSGPFRSYGQLLIVDCGGGYHFVLAGLDRLDADTGARVLAGEPVGQLGAGEENGRATLYVELRRNGQPVDPKSWFRSRG
ncbi:murein hydrolase activator EnvC [Pseudoroseomonas cervicalis]|uniref:murein hydrolase activator EnvC family protein n=1 Tax=Teichococcus cervicalis TaxID=204525 RepID=UPI0022F18531|nr:peptidoglycan DD-metalloendopeptidase family protein [Pseudoroseomonas cervicalis]WBV44004.1 peptidoglycan DD-metalloendopeptidase family protein [Pseudoroseomonas cervicalis]